MKTALLLAALATGCTAVDRPAAPAVRIITLDRSELRPEYVEIASAWSPLGFDFAFEDSGLPECGTSWYVYGETDCQITVGIYRDPALRATRGLTAFSSRFEKTITVDAAVDGYDLAIALSHEMGHIVLDTKEHTVGGIMSGTTSAMTAADRELACRSIHICI